MKKSLILKLISLLLFILLVVNGFYLARFKMLWNDEIYSQLANVELRTTGDILSLKASEGNVCPLFYLVQKAVTKTFNYRLPFKWENEWFVHEPKGQIILRINPVFFMSLSAALIFYFFSKNYSIFLGIYSLVLSLSSTMMWQYWTEARHYALWFFFTTVQFLLFIKIINQKEPGKKSFVQMAVINMFLSITVVMSVFQIFFASVLLLFFKGWISKTKIKNFIYLFFLLILPVGICFLCYCASPKYEFSLPRNISSLITSSFSYEHMAALAIFAVGVLSLIAFDRKHIKKENINHVKKGLIFFGLTCLSLIAALFIIGFYKLILSGNNGFQVSARYFIFLAPVGIISTTVLFSCLIQMFNDKPWIKLNIIILFVWLLLISFLKHGLPVCEFFI